MFRQLLVDLFQFYKYSNPFSMPSSFNAFQYKASSLSWCPMPPSTFHANCTCDVIKQNKPELSLGNLVMANNSIQLPLYFIIISLKWLLSGTLRSILIGISVKYSSFSLIA